MTATALKVNLRPFAETDYPKLVEIGNQCYPEYAQSEAEVRHDDASWDNQRFLKLRWVAADATGATVGFAQLNHSPEAFHPQKFHLNVCVDPAQRRQGVGSALFNAALDEAKRRDAIRLRGHAKADMADSLAFLANRGFAEVQRSWESRLPVTGFDYSRFAGATARATDNGVSITTLAAETAVDRDAALRQCHDLETACAADIPSVDPYTPIDFELWRRHNVDAPNFLTDAWFIAKVGAEWVGLSSLWRSQAEPSLIYQGLTGVRREHRGKGIALALKLETVRYAQAHGFTEIRTWNDTLNAPMLRINEAMGFVKQPVWAEFDKPL